MNIPMVDLKSQYRTIREEIDAAVRAVVGEAAFILGKHVERFEGAFAGYCGVSHVVGVNSGTSALHLALLACGIGDGDEVITAANTFVATAEAIAYTGARVVLVDVDPGTMNMDIERLREAITRKTKAVIPVHLYGNPVDMAGVLEVAGSAGIDVIEDAAQAHGAFYGEKRTGSIGRVGCFSFYPGKNLGAYGDGGAVVTSDDAVAREVRMYGNHGRSERGIHRVIGYTERLDGLQAAILSVKLGHLDSWNASRRRIAGIYSDLLGEIGGIIPVEPLKGTLPVHHLYVVRVEEGSRDELKDALASKGIASGIHYPTPVHLSPSFRYLGYSEGDFPVAEEAASKILSLPIYPEMTDEQVQYIVGAIEEYIHSRSCKNMGHGGHLRDHGI